MESSIATLWCGVLGALVCAALILVLQRWGLSGTAAFRLRQFHHSTGRPVSRLGGIALAAAFLAVFGQVALVDGFSAAEHPNYLAVLAGALGMFALGLWDDFKPLGAKKKLLLQVAIALGVACYGARIVMFKNPFTGSFYELQWVGIPLTVFWLVAITNLINLIDGIDGLAGGVALMLMTLLTFAGGGGPAPALLAGGMAGALASFLCFNFPPARIYMGDGGAYLLGFLIASLTIETSQKGTVAAALLAPAFALALPIIDTALAIGRRGFKGLPLFRPDRDHIHHRLTRKGLSRRDTVLVLYGISLLFLGIAFAAFWSGGRLIPLLAGVTFLAILLVARWLHLIPSLMTVGRAWRETVKLRRETRYALTLAAWLELEAERCRAARDLWSSFHFAARKMGFSGVILCVDEQCENWRDKRWPQPNTTLRRVHDFTATRRMTLELQADSARLPLPVFDQLCELAAEMWLKAAMRWQQTTGLPFAFEACHEAGAGNGTLAETSEPDTVKANPSAASVVQAGLLGSAKP